MRKKLIGVIIFIVTLSLLTIGLINGDYLRINSLYELMNFIT